MGMNNYAVVAIGRAFSDVFSTVSQELLQHYGIPVDGVGQLSPQEFAHLENLLPEKTYVPGGAVANTVSIIAALGGRAGYFGKLANDAAGNRFMAAWHNAKVEFCCPAVSRAATNSAKCLVLTTDDGNRSFVVDQGCADDFTRDDFDNFDFASTQYLLVEGYLFYSPTASQLMQGVVSGARAHTRVAVTLTCTDWAHHPDAAQFVARNADIIIGNRAEYENFQKSLGSQVLDQTICVITDGERGAYARLGGSVYAVDTLKPKDFVNSAGAGDGFAAGLLLGLARGADISSGLLAGTRVACQMLGQPTGRPSPGFSVPGF